VTISRRMLLSAGGLAAGSLTASAGRACSVLATRLAVSFSDADCRRSLDVFVALINAAGTLSEAALAARTRDLSLLIDEAVSDAVLNSPTTRPVEAAAVIGAWTLSEGRRDRSPVSIREVNRFRGDRGTALYQFTLRRDAWHGATDGDSCQGPADASYGPEDRSYLGFFVANKLREIFAFDVWLRTR